MSKSNVYIAIMAGGSGTRFWPQSKILFPKQFIDVLGVGESLLQTTFKRSLLTTSASNILVLTNERYAVIVSEQLPNLPKENIITEPLRKNTAPCLAYVTFLLAAQEKLGTLISLPSDHLIQNEALYQETLRHAVKFASSTTDSLLTLGIQPTHPHTGYGYIQKKDVKQLQEEDGTIYPVKTFTEKPNRAMAEQFIATQEFLWNAGMFVWSIESGVRAMKKYMPQEAEAFDENVPLFLEVQNRKKKDAIIRKAFESCRNISIDYALLEHAQNVYVVEASFSWNDLGSWQSVYDISEKTPEGNCLFNKTTLFVDTYNSLVKAPKDKLVLVEGLDGYIIVDTPQALIICKKENDQKIKQYLDLIKETGNETYL